MCLTALGTFLSLSLFQAFNFEIANKVFSVCLLKIIMESGIAEPEDRGGGECRSVNPVSSREGRLCRPQYYFSDLPSSLRVEKVEY